MNHYVELAKREASEIISQGREAKHVGAFKTAVKFVERSNKLIGIDRVSDATEQQAKALLAIYDAAWPSVKKYGPY